MIDAVEIYGEQALDDPFRPEFERARALLDGPEWEQGLDQLETLAYAGSMLSTICVAGCMLEGWYDHEDLPGAEAWYRVAAEAGYAAAFFGLGVTYYRMGRFTDAFAAYEQAASIGFAPAWNGLANLYWFGEGVPLDRQHAVTLWREGASLGHQKARHALARALIHGYGGLRGRIEGLRHVFRLVVEVWRGTDLKSHSQIPTKLLPTVH